MRIRILAWRHDARVNRWLWLSPGVSTDNASRESFAPNRTSVLTSRVKRQHQPADQPKSIAHVWVKLDLDGRGEPEAGLVLDWRRHAAPGKPTKWEAWVVTVSNYSTGCGQGIAVGQSWLSEAFLRPVEETRQPTWR